MKTYNIEPKEVTVADFTISAITLGDKGRGRALVNVACPKEFTYLEPGLTKNGKVRLNASNKSEGWLLNISCQGAYIRGACGNVSVNPIRQNDFKVLARGHGAFGDAGRIGTWDHLLIETDLEEFWLRVKPSRGDAYILMAKDGKINKLSYEEAELLDLELSSTSTSRGELVRL